MARQLVALLVWGIAARAAAQPTPIDRAIFDCSTPAPVVCGFDTAYPSLSYVAGRSEGSPPRGPNPFSNQIGSLPNTLGSTDTDAAYSLLGELHHYVWEAYGRDGGNGFGGTGLNATSLGFTDANVHHEVFADRTGQGTDRCSASISVDGDIVFCTGYVTEDVAAHEYAHAISNSLAWNGSAFTVLAAHGESGALGGAYSDMLGEAFERYATGANDWLLGADTPDGAIRDLASPPSIPDRYLGVDSPDRYLSPDYYTGEEDSGGIHVNAGVVNKMSYLASEGGSFNGLDVIGIGLDKVERVWYRAVSTYFPQHPASSGEVAVSFLKWRTTISFARPAISTVTLRSNKSRPPCKPQRCIYQGRMGSATSMRTASSI